MKPQIVGAWRLVSFEFRREDGSVTYPFGREARGSFIYTESGRFSVQLMRVDPSALRGFGPDAWDARRDGSRLQRFDLLLRLV
ncbi:MAG: hypothetical protein HND47_06130 [Chloroflexi bacterium]|nr:hypothetical protein [Chloroflexota bacterium]